MMSDQKNQVVKGIETVNAGSLVKNFKSTGGGRSVTDQAIETLFGMSNLFHRKDCQLFAKVCENHIRVEAKELSADAKLEFSIGLGEGPHSLAIKQAEEFCNLYTKSDSNIESLRYANRDGDIFIDLGQVSGEVVRINGNGYEVGWGNINFKKQAGQRPLVKPVEGTGIDAFRKLFPNLTLDDVLIGLGWIGYAIHSAGKFPFLVVQGEKGVGKSLFIRIVSDLIHPTDGLPEPSLHNVTDLLTAAENNVLLALDDALSLPSEISQYLFGVVTGTEWRKNALDPGGEEKLMSCRLLLEHDSANFLIKRDKLDRAVVVNFRNLSEGQRRSEEDVWAEYQRMKPEILGSVYSIVSEALAFVELESFTRITDFTRFTFAADLVEIYIQENLSRAFLNCECSWSKRQFESDVFLQVVFDFITSEEIWEGPVSELLYQLEDYLREEEIPNCLPGSASALSNKLGYTSRVLSDLGIGVRRSCGSIQLWRL